jgi:hypothetical protein
MRSPPLRIQSFSKYVRLERDVHFAFLYAVGFNEHLLEETHASALQHLFTRRR